MTTEKKQNFDPDAYLRVANPCKLNLADDDIRKQIEEWLARGDEPENLTVNRDRVVTFDYDVASERRMKKRRESKNNL